MNACRPGIVGRPSHLCPSNNLQKWWQRIAKRHSIARSSGCCGPVPKVRALSRCNGQDGTVLLVQFDAVDELQHKVRDEDGVEHGSEPDSDECGPPPPRRVRLIRASARSPNTSEIVAANSAALPPIISHPMMPTTAVTSEATGSVDAWVRGCHGVTFLVVCRSPNVVVVSFESPK